MHSREVPGSSPGSVKRPSYALTRAPNKGDRSMKKMIAASVIELPKQRLFKKKENEKIKRRTISGHFGDEYPWHTKILFKPLRWKCKNFTAAASSNKNVTGQKRISFNKKNYKKDEIHKHFCIFIHNVYK